MEGPAVSVVNDACSHAVLDSSDKSASLSQDAVMQDETSQRAEEAKIVRNDGQNEGMETENKKRKKKRSKKNRHSPSDDAVDQPDDALTAVQASPKSSAQRAPPGDDRPRSARDEAPQTRSPCPRQTGERDPGRTLGGAAGVAHQHQHRPMSPKRPGHKAGPKGGQTPSKTPTGKPRPETPKRDRPSSSKGRGNSNHVLSDKPNASQMSNSEKPEGVNSKNTPGGAKSSANPRGAPQNKRRTEARAQDGVVQTPTKADPRRGQRTPGSEGRGKNPQTPQRSKNRNGAGTPNRKNFKPFEDYLSVEEVSHGLKTGLLLQGALRINPRNYEESYIDSNDGEADIMISGVGARNRALEGDLVVVKLLDKSVWKLLEEDYIAHGRKKLQAKTVAKPGTAAETNSLAEAGRILAGDLQKLAIGEIPPDSATEPTAADAPEARRSDADDSMFRARAANRVPALPGGNDCDAIVVRNSALPADDGPAEDIDGLVQRLFPENGSDGPRGREEAGMEEIGAEEGRVEIPKRFFQKLGKVVYIAERRHSRASSGLLKPPTSSNATDTLFSPTDHRMPRMYIPLGECPEGFLERPGDFETTLFIARLQEWPKTSAIARGHLHRSLGEAGEIEPETDAMLIENGVDYSDFSDEVLDCLPKNLPWTIPQEEIAKRRDFRDRCVFTIDPATARDLDDALSCVPLGDGLYEVGVHIADVSFFVDEGNALDTVAGLRATSVYLVQKVIPMLPRLLCEHLCSLNPNEDKLTFSFLWKLTEEGEILDEWCGRSVIRSCVKMSYDHAQGVIAEPERDWRRAEMPDVTNGFAVADIAAGVLSLDKIAKNLRKKRSEDGALRLDQVKLQYTLYKLSGLPSGYSVYQQRDSNKLVEEFMLLANMAAAHRVHDHRTATALLRRHPPPKAKMMDDLAAMCADLGLLVDGTSSKSIQKSLGRYLGPRDDVRAWGTGQILTVLYSKPMQRAKYFCAGTLQDEALYRHYALNVPLYTHFTSPIRRYADILVHRQLAASLHAGPVSERDSLAIQEQAMRCNERKEAAKKCSDMSSEMFFAIFVRECGPLEEEAMVMQVLDRSIDVLVMNLGVVKRVYCNALPLKSFKFEKLGKQGRLTIVWESDDHHPDEPTQLLQLFSLVKVQLKADKEPLKFTATMMRPDIE